jgi:hypothetical protein
MTVWSSSRRGRGRRGGWRGGGRRARAIFLRGPPTILLQAAPLCRFATLVMVLSCQRCNMLHHQLARLPAVHVSL